MRGGKEMKNKKNRGSLIKMIKILLIIIGIIMAINGIIKMFSKKKRVKKRIDCGEYNENLEYVSERPMEINLYIESHEIKEEDQETQEKGVYKTK